MRRWVWLGLAVPLVLAGYRSLLRPVLLRWGATQPECHRLMQGDPIIANLVSQSTRAIAIDKPASAIWPWLVQIGQGRAGLYSYEFLENLIGSDIRNADSLLPDQQRLSPGDTIRLANPAKYPEARLVVESVDPGRSLVLKSPNLVAGPLPPQEFAYTWSFQIDPTGPQSSRLIARSRYQGTPLVIAVFELVQFIMEQAMLRGIRDRAETHPASAV